jgi:hypothetical protein
MATVFRLITVFGRRSHGKLAEIGATENAVNKEGGLAPSCGH